MPRTDLTQARLKELLHYDPDTGLFTNRITRSSNARAGEPAGTYRNDGYHLLTLDNVQYLAHRVAYLYVNGEFPDLPLDHVDGNPRNNAISNLRAVSPSTNSENMRRARCDNAGGLLGASYSQRLRKWVAQITVKGKVKHLGLFPSAQKAHAAYLKAKRELHEGCTI